MTVWWLFAIAFGILGVLFVLAFTILLYLFTAYVLARIGRKFNIGSFPLFLVPFYNIILLCDCAKVERWVTVGIILPFLSNSLHLGSFGRLIVLIAFASHVYLWGSLAKRLGKDFWLWGIITPLLGWLPAIVLAFDDSLPSRAVNADEGGQGARYIDIDM